MNKAFTLIELLAVIILLAVISLIATPSMINVINTAKDKADLESVYGILDSARLYYSESMMDNNKKTNIENLSNIYDDVSVVNKPDNGSLYINEKGLTAIAVVIRNKCYIKQFSGDIVISDDIDNCTLGYVGIDDSAPTVSFSVAEGTFNTNGWANSNFNVNITINDSESGASSYKYCIDTTECEPTIEVNDTIGFSEISTNSETNKVCVIGIDNYGNESDTICSDDYKLDSVTPTLTAITDDVTITEGDSYQVSNYFNIPTYGISGGTLICTPENTSSLSIETQTVSCTATSNSGLSINANKDIYVSKSDNYYFIVYSDYDLNEYDVAINDRYRIVKYEKVDGVWTNKIVGNISYSGFYEKIYDNVPYFSSTAKVTISVVNENTIFVGYADYDYNEYSVAVNDNYKIVKYTNNNGTWTSQTVTTISRNGFYGTKLSSSATFSISAVDENTIFVGYSNYDYNQYSVAVNDRYVILKYINNDSTWTSQIVTTISRNGYYGSNHASSATISLSAVNENTVFVGYSNYDYNQYSVAINDKYIISKYTNTGSWNSEVLDTISRSGFYALHGSDYVSSAAISLSAINENILYLGYTNYDLNEYDVAINHRYIISKYINNGSWNNEILSTITYNNFYGHVVDNIPNYVNSASLSVSGINDNSVFIGYSDYDYNEYSVAINDSYKIIECSKTDNIWNNNSLNNIGYNGFYALHSSNYVSAATESISN